MILATLGSLRPLCSVFRPALLAVLDALRVEHAAQDVVAHARQILDAAAADHHHRVFLQVMALARDVADDLEPVGETHLGDLAQRRVRLLRRGRVDARANAALLRARLQRRHLVARLHLHPRLADQLVDRRHPGLNLVRAGGLTPRAPTQNESAPCARSRNDALETQRTTTRLASRSCTCQLTRAVYKQRLSFVDRGASAIPMRRKLTACCKSGAYLLCNPQVVNPEALIFRPFLACRSLQRPPAPASGHGPAPRPLHQSVTPGSSDRRTPGPPDGAR